MYLAKRKVKGRSFISGYDKLLPDRLPEDVMLILVQKLRSGDDTVAEQIIVQHLALTIHVVGRYVASFPNKSDDLMGVGALALTEAVQRFPSVAENDNIAGYITANLHGKLARFIEEEDNTIQISTRGFEKAVAKAKETGGTVSQFLPSTTSYDSTTEAQTAEYMDYTSIQAKDVKNVQYISTIDDQTKIEVDEIFQKCCFTRFEILVYDGLVRGLKDTDIARELKYCKQRIGQVKKDIIRKLEPYYGAHRALLSH